MKENFLVLWSLPTDVKNIPCVETLSFLPVWDELQLHRSRPDFNVTSGKIFSQKIETNAANVILEATARVGLWKRNGKLLRERLIVKNYGSDWWRHSASFRDSESEDSLKSVHNILTIIEWLKDKECKHIQLVGSPPGVFELLGQKYQVSTVSSEKHKSIYFLILHGIISRILFILRLCWKKLLLQFAGVKSNVNNTDVLLQGFFDWSYSYDSEGEIKDRYFKRLPQDLVNRKILFNFMTCFDAKLTLKSSLSLVTKIKILKQSGNTFFLESHVSILESFLMAVSFRPLYEYIRVLGKFKANEARLTLGDLDWFPIFKGLFLRDFCNSMIPKGRLYSMGAHRVAQKSRAKLFIAFLEHYPVTRAQIQGIRSGNPSTKCWSIQHASYSPGKLFYQIHPKLEFVEGSGACKIPRHDRVFVMGAVAKQLFETCGYPLDAVKMIGSPRYDVSIDEPLLVKSKKLADNDFQVLITSSLHRERELDLVVAGMIASLGLDAVNVRLRSHPFCDLKGDKRLNTFEKLQYSSGSLDEDIHWADVVLFTISTVAETSCYCRPRSLAMGSAGL